MPMQKNVKNFKRERISTNLSFWRGWIFLWINWNEEWNPIGVRQISQDKFGLRRDNERFGRT